MFYDWNVAPNDAFTMMEKIFTGLPKEMQRSGDVRTIFSYLYFALGSGMRLASEEAKLYERIVKLNLPDAYEAQRLLIDIYDRLGRKKDSAMAEKMYNKLVKIR